MAFSAAALGAASASARADVVQITFTDNFLALEDGVKVGGINKDITGDQIEDLPELFTNAATQALFSRGGNLAVRGNFVIANSRRYDSNAYTYIGYQFGLAAYASTSGFISATGYYYAIVAGGNSTYSERRVSTNPGSRTSFTPVQFSDARINGGARTSGFVEVTSTNTDTDSHRVEFLRLIFNDTSTSFGNTLLLDGVPFPDFDPNRVRATAVDNSALLRQISKLKKRIKKLKQRGRRLQARKLSKRLRNLRRQLR
ncbi:MAG: hypothetical protein AAGC68_12380 [Verrucomicrobiota bacterium]